MDLLAQQRREDRIVAQTAPPIPPIPGNQPTPLEWGNFGVAIGVCIVVGNKLLGLFTQQQSTEAKMMLEYMQASERREQRAEAREERLFQLVTNLVQKS